MIEIGEGHGAVGQGAAAERQVAAGNDHEISLEHAIGAELANAVDRRREAVIGAEGIERHADGEQFSDGAGEEQLVRAETGDDTARLQVDGAQPPERALVLRGVHDRLNLGGQRWLARGGQRCAAGQETEAQGGGEKGGGTRRPWPANCVDCRHRPAPLLPAKRDRRKKPSPPVPVEKFHPQSDRRQIRLAMIVKSA